MADQLTDVYKVTESQFSTLSSGGTVDGYSYDSNALYLIEDEPSYTQIASRTSTLSSGSSVTLTLSSGISNFDMIVVKAAIGGSAYSFNLMIPAILLTNVFTSTSNYCYLKGLGTYNLRFYRASDTSMYFYTSGATYNIYVYGVNL